jgi:uncharacterized protein YyaL (SSP411 family)
MERESFESERVSAFLNENFVSIKVDREERPDVDKIYMTFVQATTGQGGPRPGAAHPGRVSVVDSRSPVFDVVTLPRRTAGRPPHGPRPS